MCVCGGTQISRGSVQMEKFGEVLWSSDYIGAKRGNFVLYSCPDWKPVERLKNGLDMVKNVCPIFKSCSCILNFLQSVNEKLWTASK